MRKLFAVLLLAFFGLNAKAQQKLDGSLQMGLAIYYGDLNNELLQTRLMNAVYGGSIRYQAKRYLGYRLQGMVGKLEGDDFYTPNEAVRGAYFTSNFISFSAHVEYFPLRKDRFNQVGELLLSWSPYLSIGAGFLQAPHSTGCRNCDETKLPEEGDKSTFLTIPFGAGLRWDLTGNITIGAELMWYPTTADYIDGISKLGKPNKDWFVTSNFQLSYYFGAPEPDMNFSSKKRF